MQNITESLNFDILHSLNSFGSNVALHEGDIAISYDVLKERIFSTTDRLSRLGIGAGDRVALQLPNTSEAVVLLLASLMVRAIPVPLLPTYGELELCSSLKTTRPKLVAFPKSTRRKNVLETVSKLEAKIGELEQILIWEQPGTDQNRFHNISLFTSSAVDPIIPEIQPLPADDTVMMLMSSGSTGLPKAIARTHHGYRYMIHEAIKVFRLDDTSVYMAAMSLCHGFTLNCPGVLGSILSGSKIILDGPDSPIRNLKNVEQHRVSHSTLVPALLAQWIEVQKQNGLDLMSLKFVQVGGARLEPVLARDASKVLGTTVQQCYGMSEGLLCYNRFDDPQKLIESSQGRPLSPEDEIKIVNEDGQIVPNNKVGELITRGPYTIKRYYRNPDADAKSFTRDGFYKTGDLAFRDDDGNVYIQGRSNDVINRAGEKFSPLEIEAFAEKHPAINMAACIGVPDEHFGQAPCLFAVCPAASPTLAEIRRHISDSGLASFKLPEHLVIVDSIPMKGIGKIDRLRLSELWAEDSGRPFIAKCR